MSATPSRRDSHACCAGSTSRSLGADRFVSRAGRGAGAALRRAGRRAVGRRRGPLRRRGCALHSLHAYFLRAGRADARDPLRGRAHARRPALREPARGRAAGRARRSSRWSRASPRVESGVAHQDPTPATPPPDELDDWEDVRARLAEHARPRRELRGLRRARARAGARRAGRALRAVARGLAARCAATRPPIRCCARRCSCTRATARCCAPRAVRTALRVGRASAGEPRPRGLAPPRARAHGLDPVRLSQSRRAAPDAASCSARMYGAAASASRPWRRRRCSRADGCGYASSAVAQGGTPLRRSSSRLPRRTSRWRGERSAHGARRRRRSAACSAALPAPAPAPPATTRAGPATRCGSSPMRSTRSASIARLR